MYSVRNVAKELNISRQAVYKKLSKDFMKEYITIVDGVKYLTDDGLLFLKSFKNSENEKTLVDSSEESLVDILNNVIKSKDKDIELLRKENEKLLELIQQQNQLLINNQNLQEKALNNVELMLLDKRAQLIQRSIEYNEKNKSFRGKLKSLFCK